MKMHLWFVWVVLCVYIPWGYCESNVTVRGASAYDPKPPCQQDSEEHIAIIGEETTLAFRGNPRSDGTCLRHKWEIKAQDGTRISYIFVGDFVLHESRECKLDYVSLRDSQNEKTVIGRYCSKSQLPKIVKNTIGSTLFVKFSSSSGLYSEFNLKYSVFKQLKGCSPTLYQDLKWPEASSGKTITIKCSKGGFASWLCTGDGNYDAAGPRMDEVCLTDHLEEAVNNKTGVSNKKVLQEMMRVADRMIAPNMVETWLELPEHKRNQLIQRMTSSIEEAAANIALSANKSLTIEEGKISIHAEIFDTSKRHQNFTFNADDTPDDGPSVTLDFDLPEEAGALPLSSVIVVYRNLSEFHMNTSQRHLEFDSSFLTASLFANGSRPCWEVHGMDVISFTIPKVVMNTNRRYCAFWDKQHSNWSDTGCRTSHETFSHTRCECDHLTFFAVLMDTSGTSEEMKGPEKISEDMESSLEVLTYIGCVLSIICLIASVVTFYILRTLWCQRITIHRNLCISLLLGQILFLSAIDRTERRVFCAVVAGLLHFIFLSAFSWMCLEGVQLYLTLIKVLSMKSNKIAWFYLSGYGLPAIIVCSSAAIYPEGYGTYTYCWLKHTHGFIWSFTGPVLLVMVVNITFLALTLRVIYKVGHGKIRSSHPQTCLQSFKRAARGAVLLQCILGTTWMTGYGYQGPNTIAFAYIFTILNSTQGVFIFCFHVVSNEHVLKALRAKTRHIKCLRRFHGNDILESNMSNSSGSSTCQKALRQRRPTPAAPPEELSKRLGCCAKIKPITRPGSVKLSVSDLMNENQYPLKDSVMPFTMENLDSVAPELKNGHVQDESKEWKCEKTAKRTNKTLSSFCVEEPRPNVTLVSVIRK